MVLNKKTNLTNRSCWNQSVNLQFTSNDADLEKWRFFVITNFLSKFPLFHWFEQLQNGNMASESGHWSESEHLRLELVAKLLSEAKKITKKTRSWLIVLDPSSEMTGGKIERYALVILSNQFDHKSWFSFFAVSQRDRDEIFCRMCWEILSCTVPQICFWKSSQTLYCCCLCGLCRFAYWSVYFSALPT